MFKLSQQAKDAIKMVQAISRKNVRRDYCNYSGTNAAIRKAIESLDNIQLYAGAFAEGANMPELERFLEISSRARKAIKQIVKELY